jgi:hypothetical protein
VTFYGSRRKLAIAEEVNLVLAYLVRTQLLWGSAEIAGELLDRMKVGPYGVRRIVTTLEFIEHQLAKMGHREPPCDPHPKPSYRPHHQNCSIRRLPPHVPQLRRHRPRSQRRPLPLQPDPSPQRELRSGLRAWDTPPQDFVTYNARASTIEDARKDYDNHRRPDVNNCDEYRHPHVPESARIDYREGFHRGYEVAMDHPWAANERPLKPNGQNILHPVPAAGCFSLTIIASVQLL